MTELLGLPEPERVDLVQRLLESLREDSVKDELDDDDRAELQQALHRSEADLHAGRVQTSVPPHRRASRTPHAVSDYRIDSMAEADEHAGEKAYEAQFEARRLASLKEAARGLGFTLVEEPLPSG